jgi:hypothetical protein
MSWKLALCKLGFHDFTKWRARARKRQCRRGCGAIQWKDIDKLEKEIRQAPKAAAVLKPGAQPGVAE